MENENGSKGVDNQVSFKYFIKIFLNDETGNYALETNVPNLIIGYGMLEFAKQGVEQHIVKKQQSQVIPSKGGILNFARRLK